MKIGKRLGKHSFYLLFSLIIVFVVTELIKPFVLFGMSIESWQLVLGTTLALHGSVWGCVATKNFRKQINKDSTLPGGN
jgi:hypothetical protein